MKISKNSPQITVFETRKFQVLFAINPSTLNSPVQKITWSIKMQFKKRKQQSSWIKLFIGCHLFACNPKPNRTVTPLLGCTYISSPLFILRHLQNPKSWTPTGTKGRILPAVGLTVLKFQGKSGIFKRCLSLKYLLLKAYLYIIFFYRSCLDFPIWLPVKSQLCVSHWKLFFQEQRGLIRIKTAAHKDSQGFSRPPVLLGNYFPTGETSWSPWWGKIIPGAISGQGKSLREEA